MEGSSAQMFVSSKGVAVHASKASAGLERDSVGVWNPGPMCKPFADTYRKFLSNNGIIAPAHVTTLDVVNGGVQVPVLSRTARKAQAYTPPPYFDFPSITSSGSPFPNEGNQVIFAPPLNDIGEVGSLRTMGNILGSSQAHSNKFDVQLSEVCQRRYVMFDRCGSKRRMIFHPALMKEFSAFLPSSLPKPGAFNFRPPDDNAFGLRDMVTVASPFLPSAAALLGSASPNHNSHLLLRKTFMEFHSSTSDDCDNPILSTRENAETKREQHGDDPVELSCYSHENTEDLEALLSSDEDEVSSTGHSPSDLTRNNSPSNSYSSNEGHSRCPRKKRKSETEYNMDDEDTCSTATSGIKMCKEMPYQNVHATGANLRYDKDSFIALHKATCVKDLGHGNKDLTTFNMFFSDEVSSSCSANNQKWDNKLPSIQLKQQQQHQPDGQSRKEKIKSILRLLRGIIPGGEAMDTAFVLDEAIQYVKTLQFEVQKLQARKLA